MSTDYAIRRVTADDWPAAKELRLAALSDPVAAIAFLETHAQASTRPDQFWKDRTAAAAEGGPNAQFVAEDAAGDLAGTVTVLLEEPGTTDFMEEPIAHRQAHLVAVFVRTEHRGGTVAAELFRAALAWARAQRDVTRVRLFVHADNDRAQAFYRKAGFVRVRAVGDEYEMEHRADR